MHHQIKQHVRLERKKSHAGHLMGTGCSDMSRVVYFACRGSGLLKVGGADAQQMVHLYI